MTDIVPGLIGLTHVSGLVGAGIRFGQLLNGDGFSTWEHAFVTLPGNQILEAEPGGAVIRPLHYSNVWWCTGIYTLLPNPLLLPSPPPFMSVAEELKGTPYSFLDYVALSAHRLGIPAPGLRDFIADNKHEICSQLVDTYYLKLDGHIFPDNRWEGDVTPGMLWQRDKELRRALA